MLGSISPLSTTLGIVSPTLSLLRSVPQSIRIVRSGAEGVSQGSWLLAASAGELWVVYGFLYHVPAEVVTNVPSCLMSVLILVLAAHHHRTLRRGVLSVALCTLAVVGIALMSIATTDHSIVAILAVSGALSLYLPQLRHVMRAQSINGLSLLSWLIAFGAAISWGIYGLVLHQLAISLPSVVLLPSSALIIARILTHPQRENE